MWDLDVFHSHICLTHMIRVIAIKRQINYFEMYGVGIYF